MKIAVLADIHLPGAANTVKEEILQWALDEAVRRKVDLIAGAGDLTSLGECTAAGRIVTALQATGLPFILAPGNAELRSPEQSAKVLDIMATPSEYGFAVTVDSARGKLSESSSKLLKELTGQNKSGLLLISHCPPTDWEEEDRRNLDILLEKRIVTQVLYGHKHIDISNGAFECIRGLDPDKASGGAPALVFMERNGDGSWKREDVIVPAAHAAEFPEDVRKNIWNLFGMSGMKTPVESLGFASEQKLPVFEIRYSGAEDFPSETLCNAVKFWRAEGGRYLSLHMPDLHFDGENFSGMEELRAAAGAAVKLGCDGVTLHVPRCFADELATPDKIAMAARVCAENIQQLFDHNISVGVENLHTNTAERQEKRYKFGCTRAECMAFINALRSLHPDKKIGLHLDIGHARNNMPFSSRETLSDWYANCGKEIVAMHIHQVSRSESGYKNHTGFPEFYGMLISLSSLAMALKSGQIPAVPLILELRCPVDETLATLRRELLHS